MADRIIAALEYLDAHTSLVLQKQKHRSLGDIDAKYDVVDPNDLPLNTIMDNRILLAGTSRTNLSREKTIDQILDEDREKILRTAQRTKSAASVHKSNSQSRPQTSLSSGGLNNENRRRSFRSSSQAASSTASRTSMKRLTFTPPGVNVGPSDARDEVIEEIVNKPLTHNPTKVRTLPTRARTAQSAPALGQQSRLSVGCRSLTSMQRSKTSRSGSKKSGSSQNKYETKPGPFTTVKVAGSDMWVVSDSTPISFFDEDISSRPMSHALTSSSKPGSWEETANSVPREEKKSPPRHERQLGAPPQFGSSQQWYTFAGNDPVKQRPVLTAFADEADNEYYSIESRVSRKVASLLQASPGIRIGVNGEIVSKTMKVHKKPKVDSCSQSSSQDSDEERKSDMQTETPDSKTEKGELASVKSDLTQDQSKASSVNSKESDAEQSKEPICVEEEENRQYSLLRYLGVAKGQNPYVTESASETTSSGADVTSLLNNIRKGSKSSNENGRNYNESEEAVWKVLEGSSPTLWINKKQWKEMRENRAKRKAKYLAAHGEEDHGPLSWTDQLAATEKNVIEATVKPDNDGKDKEKGNTVPVVFHKFVNYDKLPENFVHLTASGYRPHSSVSAVDKDLNVGPPSKGYQSTVEISPRATTSATAGSDYSPNTSNFSPRPFTSPSQLKSEARKSLEEHEVDVTDIMRVTNGSLSKLSKDSHSFPGDQGGSKLDDLSEEELEAVRLEAANKMKMTGGGVDGFLSRQPDRASKMNPTTATSENLGTDALNMKHKVEKSVTLNSLPMKTDSTFATVDIRPSKPKSSIPVGTLNLSGMEGASTGHHTLVNGQLHDKLGEPMELPLQHIALNGTRNAPDAPLNTPKTPHSFPAYFGQGSEPRSPRNDFRIHSSSSYPAHSEGSSHRPAPFKRASKSASFGSRSPGTSPRSNVNQLTNNSNLPRQLSSRTSGGFMSSPLTGRPTHKHNDRGADGLAKSAKATVSPSIIPYGNTYSDVITKSGFIQISHSLHIPSQRATSSETRPGNKIYDSYMRELSSRSTGPHTDSSFTGEKSGGIFGKSLGGTSGKAFPEHLRHVKQHPIATGKLKGGYPNFTAQGGRRSGLAITNEQTRQENEGIGFVSAPLELQGDQVRLNLDKNIHAIYRDLGIPKKTSKSSVPSSPLLSKSASFDKGDIASPNKREIRSAGRRSDGTRSHPHSARSDKRISSATSIRQGTDSPIVNIPTASLNQSAGGVVASENLSINLIEGNDDPVASERLQEQKTKVTTDGNTGTSVFQRDGDVTIDLPSSDMQQSSVSLEAPKISHDDLVDSGTQWSPHDPSPRKPDLATKSESSDPSLSVAEVELKIDATSTDDSQPKEAASVSMENSSAVNAIVEESELIENLHVASNAVVPEDDAVEGEATKPIVEQQESGEENAEENRDGLLGKRSASDSRLHLPVKEEADIDRGSVVADEEVDVRGVTKVTVNIAMQKV